METQTAVKTVIKTDKERLVELAARQGWGIIELTDLDTTWRYEYLKPEGVKTANIPKEGLERVYQILKSNIRIQMLIVGHEPKPQTLSQMVEAEPLVKPLLPWVVAPEPEVTPENEPQVQPEIKPQTTPVPTQKPNNTPLIIAGILAGLVMLPFLAPMIFLGAGLLGLLYVDPTLIVVLEDNSWIEVYRWSESSEESPSS